MGARSAGFPGEALRPPSTRDAGAPTDGPRPRHGDAASALAALSLCGCFSTTDIPGSPDDVTVEIDLSHSTRREAGGLVTSGGRVLGVTALAPTLAEAKERAYAAVGKIHFEGAHFRADIAAKGI